MSGSQYSVPGKHVGQCPECGGNDKLVITFRPGRREPLIGCPRCKAHGLEGGDFLRALAEYVGAPGGGALLDDPLRYLGHLVNRSSRTNRPPAELPTDAAIAGFHSRLWTEHAALEYLYQRRLTDQTIKQFCIGYDGAAFTFPVYADGELVQLVRRYPDKYTVTAGRGAYLYPYPLPKKGWVLVAGMFDGIVGRQEGLPVVTSICGQSFPERWYPLVEGRRIYVMYDLGEYDASIRRAEKLCEAGAEAYPITMPGRGDGKDLNDFFVNGGTADQVTAHIKQERAQHRRRAGK